MDRPDLQDVFRESAWRYFAIHAEQRLKMFQFYITISTALLGGGVLLIRTGQNAIALMLLSFLASFFSFVFWRLEVRTPDPGKEFRGCNQVLGGLQRRPRRQWPTKPPETLHPRRLPNAEQQTAPRAFAPQLSQMLRAGIRSHLHSGRPRHDLRPHRNPLDEANRGTTPVTRR